MFFGSVEPICLTLFVTDTAELGIKAGLISSDYIAKVSLLVRKHSLSP